MNLADSKLRVTESALEILERIQIFDNPYFTALQNGSMSLEKFEKSQVQFFYAVTFFSRPMSVLVARLPNGKDRLDLLRNIVEEHGDMNELNFHTSTFQRFLASIGSVTDLENQIVCPQIRAFNSVLAASCTLDELEVGIGCMGIIELAFAEISAIIGKSVVNRAWVNERDLTHYKLHSEIDGRHAEEFFRVVEKSWDDEKKRYYIKQGLELGAYIFDRLYRDLTTVE